MAKGTVNQLVFEISNEYSEDSCRRLRRMLTLLADPLLQEEVIYGLLPLVSAGVSRGRFQSAIIVLLTEVTIYHRVHKSNPDLVDNITAVFYAVTVNDAVHVLVRKLAYNSLKELSSFVKKIDYYHMFSTSPSCSYFSRDHDELLVSAAVTQYQQLTVLRRLKDVKYNHHYVMRYCRNNFEQDNPKAVAELSKLHCSHSPYSTLYNPCNVSDVIKACQALLSCPHVKVHIRKLALQILIQEKIIIKEKIIQPDVFDDFEMITLKLISISQNVEHEKSRFLMTGLLHFHKYFFYKWGGEYPSLFFRLIWNIYHHAQLDQTKLEIEQTVKIILFDQPQYSLFAVNFMNSIPFSLYSPTLLEVLLQLVEYTIKQPTDIFHASADHYLTIFKHYFTLKMFSPKPVLQYCYKVCERSEVLSDGQITTFVDLIRLVLLHPALPSLTLDLVALCKVLSKFTLHQPFLSFTYSYLSRYSSDKMKTTLLGVSSYGSQISQHGQVCLYNEQAGLKMDRIASSTLKKYTHLPSNPSSLQLPDYISSLHHKVTLSYCIHLPNDDDYYSCVQFKFEPINDVYDDIECVYIPIIKSGDTVTLTTLMKAPRRTNIMVKIEYTQGMSHNRAKLSRLNVELIDLLCQLPGATGASYSVVFEELWKHCVDNQKCKKSTGACMITKLQPCDDMKLKLNSFKLTESEDGVARFMFGLPPHHFVLVKCETSFVTVRVAIDDWRIFPVVNELLSKVTS